MRKTIGTLAACAALFMTWGATAQEDDIICFDEVNPGLAAGNPSYFDVTINTLEYDGWCLDGAKHINKSGTYTGQLVELSKANILNINKVLWILNQHYPGKDSTVYGKFVFGDVQVAIWGLVGGGRSGGLEPTGFDEYRVAEIVENAKSHGDFEPGCGEISALLLQPTLVGCPNGTLPPADQTPIQPILIEIPAECPKLACIGDFVWKDLNNNGIQESGEPGFPGVTVELIDCDDSKVVATTTTDVNGLYKFVNLTPGSYRIHVVAPAGYVFSPADKAADDVDSDADVNGDMACTELVADECEYTWDAGLYMPPPPPDNPGTGTPGYWKNHPLAWPVDSITIGCITYKKDQAIALMKKPVRQDKRLIMIHHLISAKLNVLIGNDDSCIADVIVAADLWLCDNPSSVAGGSAAWAMGAPLASRLDAYNNGRLCAPHRD